MDPTERKQLEQRIRAKALGKARMKLGFRWHLMVFVLINVLLIALNMMFTPLTLWFIWPLLGWGIGLAFHAFATFQGPAIDEAEIEAEVQRELAKRGLSA